MRMANHGSNAHDRQQVLTVVAPHHHQSSDYCFGALVSATGGGGGRGGNFFSSSNRGMVLGGGGGKTDGNIWTGCSGVAPAAGVTRPGGSGGGLSSSLLSSSLASGSGGMICGRSSPTGGILSKTPLSVPSGVLMGAPAAQPHAAPPPVR